MTTSKLVAINVTSKNHPVTSEFNTPDERSERIRADIASHATWIFRYACASPDHKRPCVHRGVKRCKTELQAYMAAMKELKNWGVLNKSVSPKCLGLSKAETMHWNEWMKGDEHQTLETAKALYKMANDRSFDEYHYSMYYMEEPAFDFHITQEQGVFVGVPENNAIDMRIACRDELDAVLAGLESVPQFAWTWFNTELKQASKKRGRYDSGNESDGSDDDQETETDADGNQSDVKKPKCE